MDEQLRQDLIRDEGLRLRAYQDTAGLWTIGVGHLLGATARMLELTTGEAMALLEADVAAAIGIARAAIPAFDRLSTTRRLALINMAFNRGGHMLSSTTITPAINTAAASGDWSKVPGIIDVSPWAQQVGPRATRIATALAGQ